MPNTCQERTPIEGNSLCIACAQFIHVHLVCTFAHEYCVCPQAYPRHCHWDEAFKLLSGRGYEQRISPGHEKLHFMHILSCTHVASHCLILWVTLAMVLPALTNWSIVLIEEWHQCTIAWHRPVRSNTMVPSFFSHFCQTHRLPCS